MKDGSWHNGSRQNAAAGRKGKTPITQSRDWELQRQSLLQIGLLLKLEDLCSHDIMDILELPQVYDSVVWRDKKRDRGNMCVHTSSWSSITRSRAMLAVGISSVRGRRVDSMRCSEILSSDSHKRSQAGRLRPLEFQMQAAEG